ncbi:MAG: hypothetical protein IT430_18150 [Phycisphaerales bacterium]|nr:hypothetical protein [Phycisphaerales bacterium]
MQRLLICAALLLLPGCGVNEWQRSYLRVSEQSTAALPVEATIEMIDCSDYADSLFLERLKATQARAQPLGYSVFDFDKGGSGLVGAITQPDYVRKLDEFARTIGADLVIYRINYVGTDRVERVETYDAPRNDTTYHTGMITRDDGATADYRGTSTSVGWETRLVTRTIAIDRYVAAAAFYRCQPE